MAIKTISVSDLLAGGPYTLKIGNEDVGSFKSPSLTFEYTTLEHLVGYPPTPDHVIKNSETATLSVNLEEWNVSNVARFLGVDVTSGATTLTIGGTAGVPELNSIELEIVFPDILGEAGAQYKKQMKLFFHRAQVASGGTVAFSDDMGEWSALPLTLTILKDPNTNTLGTWFFGTVDADYPSS